MARPHRAPLSGVLLPALFTGCSDDPPPLAEHRFDGVDDHELIADPGGLDGPGLTLEARVWPDATGAPRQNLIARRSPSGGEDSFTFRLRQDWGGVLELGLAHQGREWGTAGKLPVPRERWTFVAVTHDRATRRVCFWVEAAADACADAAIDAGVAADLQLWLGDDPRHGPGSRPFAGKMRDVRIWTVVRTAEQIRADAATPAPAGTPGLAWAG